MLRQPRTLLGLLILAAIGTTALPFLLRADDPVLELRRRELAAMTQAQREHLQRSFDQYAAMSDAQRRELEAFHAALQSDEAGNHGKLNETLQIYGDWLQSITPVERDALRKETDPVERIAMIRDLVEGQRNERLEGRMGGRAEIFGPIPVINRNDLEAMLEVVAGRAPLDESSRSELADYEGVRRSLKVIELLGKQKRTIRELLTDANMRLIMAAVSDESTHQQLESIPDSDRRMGEGAARRLKLGAALFQAIESELDQELRRKKISEENLTAYFATLPQNEQDELLSLTPEKFHQELRARYVETEWSKNRINMRLVRQFFRPQRQGAARETERRPSS